MKNVVISMLGTSLDQGTTPSRWEKWRPSIALCQQEDLLIHRFELIYQQRFEALARQVCEDIQLVSPETQVCLHLVPMDNPWDFEKVYEALHEFAGNYPFVPEKENYLIHITTGSHVSQICLFLLTEARFFPGKLVQTSPPAKKETSGPGSYTVIDLDLSRYDRIASRFLQEKQQSQSFLKSGIETKNRKFNDLIEQIEKVAIQSKLPILLMGPTGAGKSQLARKIYELKKHKRQISGPFVEVNCATLRGDASMSNLFGHVKGAFTGAVQNRPGLMRKADQGLLFLDEIGELGLDEQAMLLRAIEEKTFLPVGSDVEVQSNFQLIAGTNCDLSAAVAHKEFREDLLARINLWTFHLPPLKERKEDIEPNIRYELQEFARKAHAQISFNKEAFELYLKFAVSPEARWKGNFRDLNASITRMATFASGGRISVPVVRQEIDWLRKNWADHTNSTDASPSRHFLSGESLTSMDLFDQLQLDQVLRVCLQCRSLSEAGRQLFEASRQEKKHTNDADRLRKYLGKFGIQWEAVSRMASMVNLPKTEL